MKDNVPETTWNRHVKTAVCKFTNVNIIV